MEACLDLVFRSHLPEIRGRLHCAFERISRQRVVTVVDCQRAAAEAMLHTEVADADQALHRLVAESADSASASNATLLDLPWWMSIKARRFNRASDVLVTDLSRRAECRAARSDAVDRPADMLDLLLELRAESGERLLTWQ